ncbi:uncharacterized protein LOC114875550 [Osmia bicornis bicornis]|uniref:uncharacterized protein LOC114875550 n=1 Tax=Osmia bicornis bicornis TaxID=1437191 RepID=UPI0010F8F482|nr:uncharacterized protein LOC114875550 [Osmia bicornis bicornis]
MTGDRTAAALFRTVGDKFATGRFDFQFEEDGKRVDGTQTPTSYKSGIKRSKETSGTQWSDAIEDAAKQTFMYTSDSKGELEPDEEDGDDRADKKDGIDRIDKANGTDRIDGVDRMDETDRASRMDKETLKQEVTDATGLQTDDMDSGDRAVGTDATDRTTSTDETGKVKKMDKEVLEREAADEVTEFAMFRDECEPSCPRRISRSKYNFIKR